MEEEITPDSCHLETKSPFFAGAHFEATGNNDTDPSWTTSSCSASLWATTSVPFFFRHLCCARGMTTLPRGALLVESHRDNEALAPSQGCPWPCPVSEGVQRKRRGLEALRDHPRRSGGRGGRRRAPPLLGTHQVRHHAAPHGGVASEARREGGAPAPRGGGGHAGAAGGHLQREDGPGQRHCACPRRAKQRSVSRSVP